MKYSLRTLMIVAILAPPLLAGPYFLARYVMGNERAMFAAICIGLIALLVILKPFLSPDIRYHD